MEPVIGVCTQSLANGVCTGFVQVNNLALDSNNFNWELFNTYIGGSLLMWVTGLALGYAIKMMKKGSKF